jgi:cell fate regulator YaaT (PSP1 superfamily)
MIASEYLVSYGSSGDFSRFRAVTRMSLRRGDRVIVRSHQGLELGVVLCPVTPGHARFLSERALGELLRSASPEDEQTAQRMHERGQRLFDDARRLAAELRLPLEIVDVEVLFDGQQAIVQHLRREACDYRPLVSALSRKHDILIVMHNLVLPAEVAGEEHGCGRPDCGRTEGGGGCSSCGSGGGCASGCGHATPKEDVTAYLVGLRRQMEPRARTPLL